MRAGSSRSFQNNEADAPRLRFGPLAFVSSNRGLDGAISESDRCPRLLQRAGRHAHRKAPRGCPLKAGADDAHVVVAVAHRWNLSRLELRHREISFEA